MSYSAETRNTVRTAYVYKHTTLKTIAKKMRIPYATVCRFRNEARRQGDDWERARAAYQLAGEGAQAVAVRTMSDYMMLHQAAIEEIKAAPDLDPMKKVEALSRLSDAYLKMTSAVKRVLPEVSELAVAMEVLQRLTKFVQSTYPQHGRALVEILDPFAADLAKVYQ